ncbi:MAG TPA: 16S rRNA (guanine(527)-N(7))-methyltransferase RsmG [Clostridiales bacterium]|nr:16S rRNA (guanine(527)-N(7))-methyltransferase RsmG [Clostridiales bacterium]
MTNSGYSEELRGLLTDGAGEFGVELNSAQIDKFFKYMELLKTWNGKINLTSIEDDRDIILKHFIDSISIVPTTNKSININMRSMTNTSEGYYPQVIDIGTGAGFPGIPLKIISQEINITLLDSIDKKVKFLEECIAYLDLSKIRAFHGRAEDYAHKAGHREFYDIAVARAVANLPVLLEYCLPFVKEGGVFIAMKGRNIDEISDSNKALDILGGKIEEIREINLPFTDNMRNIIIIRKFRQTPTKYPRKAGKPSKIPLI